MADAYADVQKPPGTMDFNPFSGEVQHIDIDGADYRVRAVFVGKERLSDLLKRRILREYQEGDSSI